MDLQSVGHGLRSDAIELTQFHYLPLEFQAVTMNSPWTGRP
jgi:hypothetical protein